jgi:hypothetical protein
MGYRTVVMLSNDRAHEWESDPELGKKISRASHLSGSDRDASVDNYGAVVQVVHADTQSLAILDGYTSFKSVATNAWARNQSDSDVALALLKSFADEMGFRLVKKAEKKAVNS